MSCPAGTGGYDVLQLHQSHTDPVFRIEASGCGLVIVTIDGLAQPTLRGGPAVQRVLADLLPRHR